MNQNKLVLENITVYQKKTKLEKAQNCKATSFEKQTKV